MGIISDLFAGIPGVKQDFKVDWKETSKADWKSDWLATDEEPGGGEPGGGEPGGGEPGGDGDGGGEAPVDPDPNTRPVNTVRPLITGEAAEGQTLTTDSGTWTGSPAPTFTYQWMAGAANIPGATDATYVLTSNDVGKSVKVKVTATNVIGPYVEPSLPVGPVTGAPVNVTLPVITGVAKNLETLTATAGTWTGFPAPTFTYQWYYGETAFDGATGPTWVVDGVATSHTIKVAVTATNASGTATATSLATDVVPIPGADQPMSNDANITSNVDMGQPIPIGTVLTAFPGTWTNFTSAPTFTYQWMNEDPATNDLLVIDGATDATYTVAESDAGDYVYVNVFATDGVKSGETLSIGYEIAAA